MLLTETVNAAGPGTNGPSSAAAAAQTANGGASRAFDGGEFREPETERQSDRRMSISRLAELWDVDAHKGKAESAKPPTPSSTGCTIDQDVDNPNRAANLHQLHMMQQKPLQDLDPALSQSISSALSHVGEQMGPWVVSAKAPPRAYDRLTIISDFNAVMVNPTTDAGLKPTCVYYNLSVAELYEKALAHEPGTHIVSSGGLATLSGAKTGRSPHDCRIMRDPESEGEVWWGPGSPNFEMDEKGFLINRERAIDYLNTQERLYVVDGYVNWDPRYRFKVRIICARAYHALFMNNLLIKPTAHENANKEEPHFTIFNAGPFPCNRYSEYMTSSTSIGISFKHREMVILGTQYAGTMKKGIFTVMNYMLPKLGVLSMHSGCNIGNDDDVTVFFGLSGSGKTTLSADPKRRLIGDDEHGWTDEGVFNIEGGCYAKVINLDPEKEPDIFNAIGFGTVLENVVFDPQEHQVDYSDSSITENTRAAYAISRLKAKIPCMGGHPTNIMFLTCDAYGVLPPVSRLSLEQAAYHFLNGYSSRVKDGMGVSEPQVTFSPAFGAGFLVMHPVVYTKMLYERLVAHNANVWLINTGWTGGAYGTGKRIDVRLTRKIIDAIHAGALSAPSMNFVTTGVFNLQVPTYCPGIPEEILLPESGWSDRAEFDNTIEALAAKFHKNFRKYTFGATGDDMELMETIGAAGPTMPDGSNHSPRPLSGAQLFQWRDRRANNRGMTM